MDNLTSRKDVEQFLIGLRIRVPEEEVRKIVDALRSDSHKYRLYKGGIDRKTGAAKDAGSPAKAQWTKSRSYTMKANLSHIWNI